MHFSNTNQISSESTSQISTQLISDDRVMAKMISQLIEHWDLDPAELQGTSLAATAASHSDTDVESIDQATRTAIDHILHGRFTKNRLRCRDSFQIRSFELFMHEHGLIPQLTGRIYDQRTLARGNVDLCGTSEEDGQGWLIRWAGSTCVASMSKVEVELNLDACILEEVNHIPIQNIALVHLCEESESFSITEVEKMPQDVVTQLFAARRQQLAATKSEGFQHVTPTADVLEEIEFPTWSEDDDYESDSGDEAAHLKCWAEQLAELDVDFCHGDDRCIATPCECWRSTPNRLESREQLLDNATYCWQI